MKKLNLYLSASAFAKTTLEEKFSGLDTKAKETFKAEGHDERDYGYWRDRVFELRGKFENLQAQLTESEIEDINKKAAEPKKK